MKTLTLNDEQASALMQILKLPPGLYHLDGNPALPEEQHRAEMAVVDHADDQFPGVGTSDHRLDRKTVNPRIWPQTADALEHGGGIVPDHFRRLQVEADAGNLRLVDDIRGKDFQGDRATETCRRPAGRVRAFLPRVPNRITSVTLRK